MTVPLGTLARTVQAASGETGFKKLKVGIGTRLVALIANGLNPLRLLKSWWSGATLDELRDGPLDKHGVGSRILDATAHVDEAEIERLASFGKDRPNPMGGGVERGLTNGEITDLHERQFRARQGPSEGDRPQADGRRVAGAVAHHGQGRRRRALSQRGRSAHPVHRAAAAAADQRAAVGAPGRARAAWSRTLAKTAAAIVALAVGLVVLFAEFPGLFRPLPVIGKLVPPRFRPASR